MAASLKIMFQAFREKVTEKLNALNAKIENITTGAISADAGQSIVKGSDNLPFYKKQTAAEIKTAYESNADTNAFTDTHKTNIENLGTDLGNKADLDATGKVRPDQIPNFAITNVIPAIEADNTIELFAANSLNYIFDDGDVIEVVDVGGNLLHYLYNGGDKTAVINYRPISNIGESKETVKQKYELNPDTNAFTDANKAKVNALPVNVESTEGAQTKANAAETAAKGYADTGDAGTLVTANNYADSVGANKVDKDGTKVLSDVNFSTAKDAKLTGIESGATADQTGAEIKAAYEAELNTNAFTDADQTKLGGVEAGATADQTGAEIKSLYEGEANTNAFTDAEKTKLAGVEGSRFKGTFLTVGDLETAHPTASAGEYADVDAGAAAKVKRYIWDTSDGVWEPQSGEIAGETSASIKTKYEANADTNVFNDAEKAKLSAIEAGATADQSDAEIKTAYESNANTNAFTDALLAKINSITEIFTTALKTSYDSAASWVSTNGANVLTHIQSTHAPSNAQKNSDILKTEIEAKLTGEISSHTHPAAVVVEDVVPVSVSRSFLQSDHKKILVVSATVTLTMPSTGLSSDFKTDIDCLATGTATVEKDAGAVVLNSPDGTILDPNKYATIYRRAALNEYRLRGGFKV